MTVCNMSVEGGAKAGFIAPDEKVYAFLKDRPKAPKGAAWDQAMRYWETLRSDDDAHFDREVKLDAASLPPLVTWGTSPEQVIYATFGRGRTLSIRATSGSDSRSPASSRARGAEPASGATITPGGRFASAAANNGSADNSTTERLRALRMRSL